MEYRAVSEDAFQSMVWMVVAFVKEAPIPRSKPAIGRMATGSMKLRPTACKMEKTWSFIKFLLLL